MFDIPFEQINVKSWLNEYKSVQYVTASHGHWQCDTVF